MVQASDSLGTRKPPRDLTGKYHRWTIVEYSHCAPLKTGGYQYFWKVRCDCGTEDIRTVKHILAGRSTSCGCKHSENLSTRNRTHGLTQEAEYQIWKAIWQRCTNPNHVQYHDYGKRGITVDPRWRTKNGFQNFLFDMGPRPSPSHSIERIDNSKNYGPSNCQWATRTEQARNKRNNLNITFEERTQCLAAWAEETGIHASCLYHRVVTKGWPTRKALTTPSTKTAANRLKYDNKNLTIPGWSKEVGIAANTIRERLRLGWSVEKTLTAPVKKQ